MNGIDCPERGQDFYQGDICSYRHGEVVMMALRIIVTGGDYLVIKAESLVRKYIARTQRAVKLMSDAETAGKNVASELDQVMQTEKVVVKEGNTITKTVKREEEVLDGTAVTDKQLVITEVGSMMDDAQLAALADVTPNSRNISMGKIHEHAH